MNAKENQKPTVFDVFPLLAQPVSRLRVGPDGPVYI